jgi:hypothetical protein
MTCITVSGPCGSRTPPTNINHGFPSRIGVENTVKMSDFNNDFGAKHEMTLDVYIQQNKI